MVERMRYLCKKRGINFKKLEIELHLGNGSLAKSSDKMQCGRLKQVADYFGVTMEYLMTGQDPAAGTELPVLSPEEQSFLADFRKLNRIGKEKAADYVSDLTEQDKYTFINENVKKGTA